MLFVSVMSLKIYCNTIVRLWIKGLCCLSQFKLIRIWDKIFFNIAFWKLYNRFFQSQTNICVSSFVQHRTDSFVVTNDNRPCCAFIDFPDAHSTHGLFWTLYAYQGSILRENVTWYNYPNIFHYCLEGMEILSVLSEAFIFTFVQ